MKKLLLAIIALLVIIIIILLYCNCKSKCANCGNTSSFCASAECYGNNGSGLEGMIPYNIAKTMSQRYAEDTGKKYINQGKEITSQQDARSIWFDLTKMKKFIGFIESFACAQKCTDSMRFGIRMYYSKYPADAQTLKSIGVPAEYANMHTLFMVPTFWDAVKGENIDFDPKGKIENCKPGPIDSIKGVVYGYTARITGDGSDAENHGGLRPPPDNTGTFAQTEN